MAPEGQQAWAWQPSISGCVRSPMAQSPGWLRRHVRTESSPAGCAAGADRRGGVPTLSRLDTNAVGAGMPARSELILAILREHRSVFRQRAKLVQRSELVAMRRAGAIRALAQIPAESSARTPTVGRSSSGRSWQPGCPVAARGRSRRPHADQGRLELTDWRKRIRAG